VQINDIFAYCAASQGGDSCVACSRLIGLEFPMRNAYLDPAQSRAEDQPMATTNPIQFIQQVRAEIAKVSWPSRREVVLTSVMVFIMAALTATFFSLVDLGIRSGLSAILHAF
jgi:preprotein translocase subunit SecE